MNKCRRINFFRNRGIVRLCGAYLKGREAKSRIFFRSHVAASGRILRPLGSVTGFVSAEMLQKRSGRLSSDAVCTLLKNTMKDS